LNAKIKTELTTYLENTKATVDEKYHNTIDEILDYMNSIDGWSNDIDARRKKEIFFVDKSRNEDFIKTFPEMARLLNYE